MRAASCATPDWVNGQFSRPVLRPAPVEGQPIPPMPAMSAPRLAPPPAPTIRRHGRAGGKSKSCRGQGDHPSHRGRDLGNPGQVRAMTPIRMVALDMAGTTVSDAGAVEEAFQGALDAVGLVAGDLTEDPESYVRRTIGQSKIDVFTR